LYIDPPHSIRRPGRPTALGNPAIRKPQPASQPDSDQRSHVAEPQIGAVVSTETDLNEPARLVQDALMYQAIISSPPAEPMIVEPTRDRTIAESVADAVEEVASVSAKPSEEDVLDAASASQSLEAAGAERQDRFRPAWEVDSLGLPPVCRQVVERVSAELSSVCQFLRPANGAARNLVSIDSCTRGEGRTTIAIALAHALAQQGQRILLVDADFGHPNLATQLGLAVSQGWENSVTGDLPVQDCCIYSIGDGFAVLPLGCAGLEVQDLETLQRIQELLLDVSAHFDRVVLDQGPGGHSWVGLPPQRLLAHVVVRSLRTTANKQLQRFVHRIQQRPEILISLVDNFATPSALAVAKSA
jgi:Mrp family chromosome partitioning ATPase